MPTAKDLLQGKPLRCPVHVALVHLPIALFALGTLLDVASWIWARPEWRLVPAAFLSLVLGVAAALLAAIPGFVDYSSIRGDHPGKKKATWHMVLNLVAVGLYALSIGLRFESLNGPRTDLLALIVSLIAFGVIGFSGYLGGSLVYEDGIGVGRHRHEGDLPQDTREIGAGAAQPVCIGRADEIPEGQTARVNVEGTTIVVARQGGQWFALQEFCTHRYGPMSEGRLEAGEIVCPWHNSRFELASGKPCGGPAKLALRRYTIEERDGRLFVHGMPRDSTV